MEIILFSNIEKKQIIITSKSIVNDDYHRKLKIKNEKIKKMLKWYNKWIYENIFSPKDLARTIKENYNYFNQKIFKKLSKI